MRVRTLVRTGLVALGVLALAAPPAFAHNTYSESSFSAWKGFRTKIAYSTGGTKLGEVRVEARRMPYGSDPSKGYYGFRVHYITDIFADNANNNLYCIEAWMDFKRLNGAGPHRNPTVIRKCNFGGSPTSYHNGMTDVVLHENYADFVLNICQVYMNPNSGVWDRYNCHGDDGNWPDDGGSQDVTTDSMLGACLSDTYPDGQSYLTDYRWIDPWSPGANGYGCMGYIHWV